MDKVAFLLFGALSSVFDYKSVLPQFFTVLETLSFKSKISNTLAAD